MIVKPIPLPSIAPYSAPRHARRRPGWSWRVLLLAAAYSSSAAALSPGRYEITSQTVMPHLDEMRRISAVETRCLADDATALFPVLRQPALRGCTLVPTASATDQRFDLQCQTTLVATGSATVAVMPQHVKGDLSIKMGGKNMTFSQHVRARPQGPCSAE